MALSIFTSITWITPPKRSQSFAGTRICVLWGVRSFSSTTTFPLFQLNTVLRPLDGVAELRKNLAKSNSYNFGLKSKIIAKSSTYMNYGWCYRSGFHDLHG